MVNNKEGTNVNPTDQNQTPESQNQTLADQNLGLGRRLSRRKLLRNAGIGAAGLAGAALIGCDADGNPIESNDKTVKKDGLSESLNPFHDLRLSIENLPGEEGQLSIANAKPINLVIREGGAMSVRGVYKDENGLERVVFSVTDPKRQGSDGILSSFSGTLPLIQSELPISLGSNQNNSSFSAILEANGGSYDKEKRKITLKDGTQGTLKALDEAEAKVEIDKMGVFFVDEDPLKKNPDGSRSLHKNPVIEEPPSSIIYKDIRQSEDGRILALDSNGNAISRAISQRGSEWRWTRAEHLIDDYTISELLDAQGRTLQLIGLASDLRNPQYVENFLSMANRLKIPGPMYSRNLISPSVDWRSILSNWDNVKAQLADGKIPFVDKIFSSASESQVKSLIDFAERNNMPVTGTQLWWWSDMIDPLHSNDYSPDDKRKMVEFIVKAKVLRFPQIRRWIAASEVSGSEMSWFADKRYGPLYRSLGGRQILADVAKWAKEARPDIELAIIENEGLDSNNEVYESILNNYLSILSDLRSKGAPIDLAGFENNFWIYAPPNKDEMKTILRRVRSMGYRICPPETTIAVSERFPIWEKRPRTVQSVPNKEEALAKINMDAIEAYIEEEGELGYFSGTDANTWYNYNGHTDAQPELVDRDYKPKPAQRQMIQYLKTL